MDFYKKRINDKLKAAIKIMLEACDEAERNLERYGENEIITKPGTVLHSLSWGFANASSQIEISINNASRMHEEMIYKLTKDEKNDE